MTRQPGFRGEYLWELEIAERQLTALASAFTDDQYHWKPAENARTIAEVFVHLAAGNFMLLDILGTPAPADLYPDVASLEGPERFTALIRHNDELDRAMQTKEAVAALLTRALKALREAVTNASDESLEHPIFFFGEQTTIRRGYLRVLVHQHEHMGQLTGYMRLTGAAAPWPDWRPDRR